LTSKATKVRCAEDLGKALRVTVPAPVPARIQVSAVDGSSQVLPLRSNGGAAPVVDAEAARLGQLLDKLDAALSLCAAIHQAREFDQRGHRLGLLRGTASEFNGAYRVLIAFRNLSDGLEFLPGTLIDSSLVGPGMMSRLQTGRRHIEPERLA
jgi:hypothetical protein